MPSEVAIFKPDKSSVLRGVGSSDKEGPFALFDEMEEILSMDLIDIPLLQKHLKDTWWRPKRSQGTSATFSNYSSGVDLGNEQEGKEGDLQCSLNALAFATELYELLEGATVL